MKLDYTEEELDLVITVRDMRQAGACIKDGQMAWFKARGFDFRKVMKEGVTIREIVAFDDGQGLSVINRIIEKRRTEVNG